MCLITARPPADSLLTGKRPDSTNTYTFQNSFRENGIDSAGTKGAAWVTLPQVFKEAGWTTIGPVHSKVRVPLLAARTLNATGQHRVTLSLR